MNLLRLFRQNIDLDTYKQMLREVFKADELLDNSHIEELPVISDDDKGYYIGNNRTSDRYNIGFFYYEIGRSNVARKKVGLRNLVHKFINSRDGQFDAALVAFKDASHWRLSFICDIKDEATAPKRFTFVFGDADNLYKTPLERFGKLQQKGITKTNIQDAFSVEALNDQFFADYKAHYEAFVEFITGKRFVKEGGKWVEKVMHDPHPTIYPQFKCDDKSVRDYVKQMMGRIVFLHFLQKKGWMGVPADAETWEGGDQNFMFKLFQCATPAQKNDFLDTVLEPLFFECLNTERERDIYVTPIEAIGKVRIPYLNGELFEKTELDKTECKFDVKLFENLFNLFNSYNFTIDENDPSDAEIGVDPEMLGKIFENLLEDNKDKGAFYTPKEIVSYMCKESLIAYLQSKIGKAHHDSIRTLVNTHLKDQHLEEDQNVCERLNKALRDVKVCDPAIGSGAFPMGLLNEIFACRCQLETTDKPKSELKGEIIQNNIYGVDIERGAVDIARLRFWLALIVDAEKPVPLPNLDYKIMQGNSLLESFKGQDLTKFMENAFAQPYAIQLNKDLKKYFKETNNTEKLKLRKSIDYTIKQCIFQCGIQDEIELPNTEFFLWHTYFKDVFDEGGFDIVIGNPPYVGEKGHKEMFQKVKQGNLGQYHQGKMDYFYFFFHLGLNILSNNGIVSFITTNYYVTALGGSNLRKDINNRSSVIKVLNFNEFKIFKSALGQHNMITMLRKGNDKELKCDIVNVQKRGLISPEIFCDIIGKVDKECLYATLSQSELFETDECYIRLSQQSQGNTLTRVLSKIANGNEILNNVCKVNVGLRSGIDRIKNKHLESFPDFVLNQGIFVVSESELSTSETIVKPFYKNSDIKKFYTNSKTGMRVIYSTNKTKIEDFSDVYTHLLKFKDVINEYRWEENTKWYALVRPRNEDIFTTEKIVAPQRSLTNTFGYNEIDWYASSDVYYITNPSDGYKLKYILGLLNSKLYYTWLYNKGKRKGEALELYQKPLSEIPIKKASSDEQELIISYVDKILSAKKSNPQADTSAEEREIDRHVYELFGLTNGEVKIIDPNETTVGSDDELFKA